MINICNFQKKEQYDEQIIDSTFRQIVRNKTNNMKTHFIFASTYYQAYEAQLILLIQKLLKKYQMESILLTNITIMRGHLITKEFMELFCKGKQVEEESIHYDLESYIEAIKLGIEQADYVNTYFLPKLTQKELDLVAMKDPNYLKTFQASNPDVPEAVMKLSESSSKYIYAYCWRRTIKIEHSKDLFDYSLD